MSRPLSQLCFRQPARAFFAAAPLALAATLLPAQYPGLVAKSDKSTPVLRSVAVLEWTGDPGKPTASRLVPVAVFDGAQLNDGTIYLNRPQPLALAGGTEYELQAAGKASRLFDVSGAGEIQGTWLGFGAVKPLSTIDSQKSANAFNTSSLLNGGDAVEDDKPVLKRKHPRGTDTDDPAAKTDSKSSSTESKSSGEPSLKRKTSDTSSTTASTDSPSSGSTSGQSSDPDRPTLKRKESTDAGTSAPDSGSAKPAGEADPDRPSIRRARRSNDAGDASMLETSNLAPDPDRPRLRHGKPAELMNTEETRLIGTPSSMQQAVAVSDASNRAEHPWKYSWANPEDETKMKEALEAIARTTLGLDPPPAKPAPKTAAARAAAARAAAHRKTSMLPAQSAEPVPLTDEQFRVFELTYGATATLVLTAASPKPPEPDAPEAGTAPSGTAQPGTSESGTSESSDEPPPPIIKRGKPTAAPRTAPAASPAKSNVQKPGTQKPGTKKAGVQPPTAQKFVTLVAQPDLYGNVLVLYKSVTDSTRLDDTPKMRLIDAVDAMGDNRGELLFELRGTTQRQFALFRVLRGSAEQLFATVALP